MKSYAFVFPGQGSQQLGMLSDLASHDPLIEKTFNVASDVLGYDLWALTQEGPEEKLNETQYTQPALLAAGVAVWNVWKKNNAPEPLFFAGHSLGEYTALVCSNVIDFETAITLVEQRGKYMQEAVPVGRGGMAAIIGLDEATVNDICELSSVEDQKVSPANYNSIGQIVIAGDIHAIDRAVINAKEEGAKIAKKLPVSVPSHCSLMEPAALQLAEKLKEIRFLTPRIPVVNNVDVCCYQDPDKIRDALIRQLYSPVRWVETVQLFAFNHLSLIIESGPGKVLTGLNKRITDSVNCIAISQPSSFQEALSYIGE